VHQQKIFIAIVPMKKRQKLFNTALKAPRVGLVGVILPTQKKAATIAHLKELAALARTAQMQVVDTFMQKLDKVHTNTLIGKGKVAEIGQFIQEHKIDRIIFDDEVSPAQAKNLEKAWKCEVWDRSLLILKIFALHARTVQAKTQVALAQYQYLLPRLTGMWTHHSRQQGGVGLRGGPGEKELETDRRLAQQKIKLLKKKLAHMSTIAKTQRKQRQQQLNVALVGYTNAGKSTLMRCLSKEEVFVADQLFATLSPTVRQVVIKDISFLLADTVGFIRKLPHTLVACFKSTLAEVQEADVLLHVVDFSHDDYEAHIHIVHQILKEIEAQNVPIILVLNKEDQAIAKQQAKAKNSGIPMSEAVFLEAERVRLSHLYACPVIYCSAIYKKHIQQLQAAIYRTLKQKRPQ